MRFRPTSIAVAAMVAALAASTSPARAGDSGNHHDGDAGRGDQGVQLGPRPYYLVQGMDDSPLKDKLASCQDGPFKRTDFSIGHRGAALQFPEHTKEAYQAGARMLRADFQPPIDHGAFLVDRVYRTSDDNWNTECADVFEDCGQVGRDASGKAARAADPRPRHRSANLR